MNFDFTFTEMETCILEKAVQLYIIYNQNGLEKEEDEEEKAILIDEIAVLNNILKKIQEKLD